MHRSSNQRPEFPRRVHRRGTVVMAVAAVAALAVVALAGSAVAKLLTLNVEKGVKVASKTEAVATSGGKPVYWLGTETPGHLLCTSTCLTIWLPVKAASAHAKLSDAAGIKGRLGEVHRGGLFQVTLGGHLLYTFKPDPAKGSATGNGIQFKPGAIWHVVSASAASQTRNATTTSSMTTTSTTSRMTSSTYTYSSYSYPGY